MIAFLGLAHHALWRPRDQAGSDHTVVRRRLLHRVASTASTAYSPRYHAGARHRVMVVPSSNTVIVENGTAFHSRHDSQPCGRVVERAPPRTVLSKTRPIAERRWVYKLGCHRPEFSRRLRTPSSLQTDFQRSPSLFPALALQHPFTDQPPTLLT